MDFKSIGRLAVFIILLSSCSGSRNTKTESPRFSVSFGKTGGFTNLNPIYTIFSSGEVTRKSGVDSIPVIIKKLQPNQIDSVFQLLKATGFLKNPINHPGNISNYIELKQDTLKRKIIWNDNFQLTPDIRSLQTYLMLMIKK